MVFLDNIGPYSFCDLHQLMWVVLHVAAHHLLSLRRELMKSDANLSSCSSASSEPTANVVFLSCVVHLGFFRRGRFRKFLAVSCLEGKRSVGRVRLWSTTSM